MHCLATLWQNLTVQVQPHVKTHALHKHNLYDMVVYGGLFCSITTEQANCVEVRLAGDLFDGGHTAPHTLAHM